LDNGSTNMEVARLMSPDLKEPFYNQYSNCSNFVRTSCTLSCFMLGESFKDAKYVWYGVIELLKLERYFFLLGVCGMHHKIM
jgi:hypothetical protein